MTAEDTAPGEIWKRRYRQNEAVVSRKIAGELFLVPVSGRIADMQRMFALGGVGGFIWERLDGRRSLGEIRDEMLSFFEVEGDEAEADIGEFVTQLLEADLVNEEGAA